MVSIPNEEETDRKELVDDGNYSNDDNYSNDRNCGTTAMIAATPTLTVTVAITTAATMTTTATRQRKAMKHAEKREGMPYWIYKYNTKTESIKPTGFLLFFFPLMEKAYFADQRQRPEILCQFRDGHSKTEG